ncbi:NAD-dependent epimerase/dehydratase family protein [Salinibacterium sp. NSLL150]|uniref:NAD-dependent epimerase/dehydratase family protein n=1 Tax=unclassified Salinibacterium TaxID=2632331 RepID=UPI0018CD4A11|nr:MULTISPECIES: NAD-dependent epimerase/dehydratase family protein [unclassified Salinibacterium]MBH0098505.1 NAD-dependent epimerase/dehydratase family protein [Salinibacterium sp. NSLL35]MBH0101260.1 NAD-dependent epimerase/dehydratase family protein [Salinibacterium sp. NSLL150]MBH0104019.1 NAD-dependent epimerase/dehydratase family protein [Salinibacterium sp. NSLL16]MBH0106780.1 NAD-dependent epimerase/dehydratase family protein [Salinibacterium sp. NSLL17]MBH0109448.1 NAD-dependent epim
MKILVVGGSGFIGTRLLETLHEQGHQFTNFDRLVSARFPEQSVTGDVRSADELTAASVGHDAIINLAAEHRDDVSPLSLYTEVNVGGAHALVAAAEANGIQRIVFTSTVALYGLDKNDAAEDSVPEPFNEYGRSKLAAEGVFSTWANADAARSLAIVRPSVVFGEGNRGNVYNLAKQVSSGRFIMVGKGDNKKSMSYVGNIVGYIASRLEAPTGIEIRNFADKPDLSTKELISILRDEMDVHAASGLRLPLPLGIAAGYVFDAAAKITRRTFPISAVRIRKFAADTTVNTDRLRSSGYTATYSLQDALKRTLASEFPHRGASASTTGSTPSNDRNPS